MDAMDFYEVVQNRHSIRNFEDRDVDEEKVNKVLGVVNSAPSAGNVQAYTVVIVRDQATKKALARAAFGQDFVARAPVNMVFCADHLMSASRYGERGANLYAIQDATIAAAYAELAATVLGLGSVWVGAFDPAEVAAAVSAPEHMTPVAIIPIGYAETEPVSTTRRHIHEMMKVERF